MMEYGLVQSCNDFFLFVKADCCGVEVDLSTVCDLLCSIVSAVTVFMHN